MSLTPEETINRELAILTADIKARTFDSLTIGAATRLLAALRDQKAVEDREELQNESWTGLKDEGREHFGSDHGL